MNLNPDDFIVVSKPNYAVVKEPGVHAFFAADANMRAEVLIGRGAIVNYNDKGDEVQVHDGAITFFMDDELFDSMFHKLPPEPDGLFYISLEDLYKAELDGEPIDLFIHDIKSGITAKEEISTVLHGGIYQDEDYGATWVALTE